MSNILKKSVAIFTSVTTIAWLSGVAMLAPVMVQAAVVDGDLVQNPNAEGDAKFDVYIVKDVDGEMYKRLILNPQVFESYGHLSWDDIQEVSEATIDSYDTSYFVYPDNDGDGVADGSVYFMSPDGDTGARQHVEISAEDFGDNYSWNSVYVINATDFGNYSSGDALTSVTAVGEAVEGEAGDEEDEEESEGTLTVSLAADTPASDIVIGNSTRNPFTKVNVTASGGDVVIDTMTVKRTGIGQDGAFSGINVVDEDTNRTVSDTDKTLNSDNEANITDNVTVEEGETKTLTIVGTLGSTSSYSGETPILQLEDMTLSGDATLSASFPVVGNAMTVNSSITLGTVTTQRGAYSNATSSNKEIGTTDYTVYSFSVQAPSDEDLEVEYFKLYNEGSVDLADDLENIELYDALSGEALLEPTIDGNYLHFDLGDDPYIVEEGDTAQFKVEADFVDGSSRTLKLSIYRENDLLVQGQTYDAYITPTYSGTGSGSSAPYLTDNQFTVGTGSFTVRKSNEVGSENIAIGSDQTLGAFLFDVTGEEISVTEFTLKVASSSSGNSADALKSVKLVDPDGNVVAGPTDIADGSTNVAWTDTFNILTGENVYTVEGTLSSNKGWTSDDTITVSINTPATKITAEGETTGETITAGTTGEISANQQTVKTASLSVSRNSTPGDKTVIVGTSDVELGAWTLDATDAGEDVRITQIAFAGRGQAATNTDNMAVYMDGEVVDSNNPSALSSQPASSTFTFTDPIIIEKGTTETITLKGDKDSTASNATEQWGLTDKTSATNASVVCYGDTTGDRATVTLTADDGATITSAASGTLTLSLNGAPASEILLGGASMQKVNQVNFAASDSDIEVDELIITLDDGAVTGAATGNHSEVDRIYLKVNGGFVGSEDGYAVNTSRTTINLGDGELEIGSNDDVDVEIYADIAETGDTGDPGDANASFKVGIAGDNSVDADDSAGNTASYSVSATSSAFVLHKSKPTVSYDSGSTTTNAEGSTMTLFSLDITAPDEGEIGVYTLSFLVSTGTMTYPTDGYVYLDSCSSCMLGGSTVSSGQAITATQGGNDANLNSGKEGVWSFNLDNQDTSSVTQEALEIPAGQTATLLFRAKVNGFTTTGKSLTTKFLGDNVATTTDETTGDKADEFTYLNQGNFVWSDLYSDGTGSDTTTTAQWYNGYLVDGASAATSTEAYTISYQN